MTDKGSDKTLTDDDLGKIIEILGFRLSKKREVDLKKIAEKAEAELRREKSKDKGGFAAFVSVCNVTRALQFFYLIGRSTFHFNE